MDVEKSCVQLAEKRKETTFQICFSPTNFLNLELIIPARDPKQCAFRNQRQIRRIRNRRVDIQWLGVNGVAEHRAFVVESLPVRIVTRKCLLEKIYYIMAFPSLCAVCREVVPTKPFTNTALYYKMMFESEPTPLATKCLGGFYGGSKANVGHYKMALRSLQNDFA